MGKFIYEYLNDTEFENLVIDICKVLFGIACKTYSLGKDGGKDSFFEGIAQQYPNSSNPWSGITLIQAKHTTIFNASCSDNNFFKNKTSTLKKEIQALKEQKKLNPFNNYLIFTNRKLPGTIHLPIKDFLKKELVIENADIIGREEINNCLIDNPHIADKYRLHLNEEPLRFYDADIKKIIISFHQMIKPTIATIESSFLYISKEKKNSINNLSQDYFDFLKETSLPYFELIDNFLKDPRNRDYLEMYLNTVGDLQEKIIIDRERFDNFDKILHHLSKYIIDKNTELLPIRRFVTFFIHYMYFNCDIGKK